MNVNFRLDDGHEASGADLRPPFELLTHNVLDTGWIGLLDDRAHLGAEDAIRPGLVEQGSKLGHGLHQLHAILFRVEALVHFQKGDNPFHVPEIVGGRLLVDVPVHGALEQDGPKDSLAGEAGTSNDPAAHLMHEGEHLLVVGPGTLLDAIVT
jgi:hypothetical protein